MKNILIVFILIFVSVSTGWTASKKALSEADLTHLKRIKQSLGQVDEKSLEQSILELEKSPDPRMNLTIKEAMMRTYTDIVQEQQVEGLKKKQWLYSMVNLNMAYLQFAGQKDSAGGTTNLNKLIRRKLKTYLPSEIFNHPYFHVSIE